MPMKNNLWSYLSINSGCMFLGEFPKIRYEFISYVGLNRRLVLNEVKPNVYREIFQKQ